ncbi:hypothetical protein G7068_16300 [Leucobacter viscericola]|nr:hypothetical protein [Leucobacter viscericola]QIK64609.1 hypothetical protein G7068_16300 [Leucobacter viscericola]
MVDIAHCKSVRDLVEAMAGEIVDFDSDEEFTNCWSAEFAEHNGFTPLSFIRGLEEDARHFRRASREMKKLLKWGI